MFKTRIWFWISLIVAVFLLILEAIASWFFTVLIVFFIFPPLFLLALVIHPILVLSIVAIFLVITDFAGSLKVEKIEWLNDMDAYNGLLHRSLHLAEKIGVYVEKVGIAPYDRINAFSYGIFRPKIVIFKKLLEEFNPEEVDFVIAHEMAHIKHRWIWIIHNFANAVTFLPFTTPPPIVFILYTILIPARLAFLWFLRECEFLADREALAVTGNIIAAIGALAKLGRIGKIYDIKELKKLVSDRDIVDRVFNDIAEMLSSHPLIKRRIREILETYQTVTSFKSRTYCLV